VRARGPPSSNIPAMPKCETCGNDYDKAFTVVMHDVPHVFDSFECAIQALAPRCEHCDCRIIGHGMEAYDRIYCCAHCAACDGEEALRDRAA
jgi:hypothetical protein